MQASLCCIIDEMKLHLSTYFILKALCNAYNHAKSSDDPNFHLLHVVLQCPSVALLLPPSRYPSYSRETE